MKRTQVQLVDDLDGGEASRTVHFGIGGISYEIDLSEKNAEKFEKVVAPYLEAARRVRRTGGSQRSSAPSSGQAAAIRKWARQRGLEVPERGRIPAHLLIAYSER